MDPEELSMLRVQSQPALSAACSAAGATQIAAAGIQL
jgi:hypothetical protein